tara:strand:+ start:26368 stop:26808 length:441 start_codon:yes stop_codon:yes gene_type:complete
MLHPNKTEPQRYRVWDREMNIQRYFPLTKVGKQAAYELDSKVSAAKNAKILISQLGINKLFAQNGSVIGLKRKYRIRKDRASYECFCLYACGKQTEFVINSQNFENAFNKSVNWLLDKHGIAATFEIKQMFRKAKRFYWNSVKPNH